MKKLGVLIGGSGRTLKNLIDVQSSSSGWDFRNRLRDLLDLQSFKVQCVVSHKETVPGLAYARDAGIPFMWGNPRNVFPWLESQNVDLAVMAGWVKLPGNTQGLD